MALVVSDIGELQYLDLIRSYFETTGQTIRLFKNNHTPTDADTVADYTEADFADYGVFNFAGWSAVYTDTDNIAKMYMTSGRTWTKGIGTNNDIYGYYVTRNSDGELLHAERDPAAPIAMNTAGTVYFIVPTFQLRTIP